MIYIIKTPESTDIPINAEVELSDSNNWMNITVLFRGESYKHNIDVEIIYQNDFKDNILMNKKNISLYLNSATGNLTLESDRASIFPNVVKEIVKTMTISVKGEIVYSLKYNKDNRLSELFLSKKVNFAKAGISI